jgi:hypothetical protein
VPASEPTGSYLIVLGCFEVEGEGKELHFRTAGPGRCIVAIEPIIAPRSHHVAHHVIDPRKIGSRTNHSGCGCNCCRASEPGRESDRKRSLWCHHRAAVVGSGERRGRGSGAPGRSSMWSKAMLVALVVKGYVGRSCGQRLCWSLLWSKAMLVARESAAMLISL